MVFSCEDNNAPTKRAFDPTPIPTDRTWGFRFTLQDGTSDVVTGFGNEAEARAWLASNLCDQWLKSRGYVCDRN
jgi:hypothetical protein